MRHRQGTAGRFCERRCYAPAPGPSHQAKPRRDPAPVAPVALLEEDAVDVEDAVEVLADDGSDGLAVQPVAPQRVARAARRQPHERPGTMTTPTAPSWWVQAPREQFSTLALEHQARMRASKENRHVPVRILQ